MKTYHSEIIVDGLMFPESPRWYQDKLWFTDQHAQTIMTTDIKGNTQTIAQTPDLPGGLGWLPDGTLVVVYMTRRQLYQLKDKQLVPYADLYSHATFHCNDMIMDSNGNSWVGNFGYDLANNAPIKSAEIIYVNNQGKISTAAQDVIFPNGCVIDEKQSIFIVAETFASRLTQFSIGENGELTSRQLWADLIDGHPDGICWDNNTGIWVALPNKGEVWQVNKGGQVKAKIKTQRAPYACMTGGSNHELLWITSSATSDPKQAKELKSGCIEVCRINDSSPAI